MLQIFELIGLWLYIRGHWQHMINAILTAVFASLEFYGIRKWKGNTMNIKTGLMIKRQVPWKIISFDTIEPNRLSFSINNQTWIKKSLFSNCKVLQICSCWRLYVDSLFSCFNHIYFDGKHFSFEILIKSGRVMKHRPGKWLDI